MFAIPNNRELLKEDICWTIVSRHNTNIWNDLWIPNILFLRIIENIKGSFKKKVTELIDQCWRLDFLIELFPTHVVEVIKKIHLSIVDRNGNDTPICTLTPSSNLSTKSIHIYSIHEEKGLIFHLFGFHLQ